MAADAHDDLLDAADAARARAYVPYSSFAMGAAVQTDRGAVVPGALVENVSLGLAMCAERVALFGAVAQGAGRPVALALVAPLTDGRLTFPCGACLQVALELGGPELEVRVRSTRGLAERRRLGDLLPHAPRKAVSGIAPA
jgi:cytidine deaminase